MKVVYTDVAIDDLKRLRAFIATHNPAAAAKISAELIGKIELLAAHPKMGVAVEMAPDPNSVRDVIFGPYVIRYSLHTSTIIILRIWHGLEGAR